MNSPIFLSHFLNDTTPVYGGEENSFVCKKTNQIKNGDTSNNLHLSFPNHIGTHIDFPLHFSADGLSCSDFPASFWIFNNIGFLNCSIDEIEIQAEKLDSDIEMLIIKTGFGKNRNNKEYWKEQPVIPASLANFLKSKFSNLRLFGFDMISLTSKLDKAEGKNAHLQFLIKNNILILEDMDLSNLHFTPRLVIVSPMLVSLADGVPCTVIAQ
jgi:arylformamidase